MKIEVKDQAVFPSPAGRGQGEGKETKPVKPPIPPEILHRCRELRKNATDAENLIWQLLRDRRFLGFKFRRQQAIDRFIVDFYCHGARLVIELDGGGHNDDDKAAYDAKRTAYLESKGYRVLRFWNDEVLQQTEAVLQAIAEHLLH